MELLIPHACKRCGAVDEAKLIYAGPHIKQVCNGCNAYVKFYSKYLVPDAREIVFKIQSITTDVNEIESIKAKIGFLKCDERIDKNMMYWRLYLAVRATFLQKEELCK